MAQQLPLDSNAMSQPADKSLAATSPLSATFGPFTTYMVQKGWSPYTVKSFLGDLHIFARWANPDTPVFRITTARISEFMAYLVRGRGKPCTPKSYARRLTTLKVFFGWLAETGVLGHNPADAVPHHPAVSPLPMTLHDDQVKVLLETARAARSAEKPDSRPFLLVSLVLDSGIKKSECMALKPGDIDTSDPKNPVVNIRHSDARSRHKDRRLRLGAEVTPALREYLLQYRPMGRLFPCTARNLEYQLTDLARVAGLPALSFEMLRWTAAVRDYKGGMDPERLRQKMGLTETSWPDTLARIKKLAEEPI
jgi:integrase/recombinase XerD